MDMSDAAFIWSDPEGVGRNRTVLFRTTFELPEEPAGGELHLFADTRYRLLVNGTVLGHGPARFFTAKPEYDTYDLRPVLRQGRNAVAVVVNSTGGVAFHAEASVGGLVAWGEARDAAGNAVPLATGESWRALESPAHRSDTHYMCFALNPAECFDARKLPADWAEAEFDDGAWPQAVLHAHPGHWGPLEPRSIPLLDESPVRPGACLGAWAAREDPDEEVASLLVIARGGKSLHTDARVAVMTHIHSPRDQQVTFGAWWGRYWMNGEPLEPSPHGDSMYRQDFTATLHEGWNTLQVVEAWKQDWWDFYLALPRSAGLELSAECEIGSPNVFLIGGLWEDELAEAADAVAWPLASPDDLPEELGPWQRWPRGRRAETPCRERAWRAFERIAQGGPPRVDVAALAPKAGEAALALLFDFGTEVLGRPVVDFTAAEGTVVDVAYTERLQADGSADVNRRYFVDMAERCVAREGRQTWQTLHPRGCRYLEVLVRGDLAAFQLHDVALTWAAYPTEQTGSFECSDPLLNRIWALGPPTLRACMEDAYLDCPWRERGLYTGDFLVEFLSNHAVYGDTALFRRCIELFFLSQGENGLVCPCPHGLPPGRHPDYSAILVLSLWQYYAATGDAAFVEAMEPRLRRLIEGLEALIVPDLGLVDGTRLEPYVDSARTERAGLNCALNGFVVQALRDGASCREAIGRDARNWRERADALAEAIRVRFWDPERRVFLDRLREDNPETGPSVAGNALALLYGIAECDQTQPVLDWLADAMVHNFRVPEPAKGGDCNVSSYFSYYALAALYEFGRVAEAEQFMRTCWGHMLDHGAWTAWEHFTGTGSLCHAWSTAPTYHLSAHVLGVRFPEPGNPDVVRVMPHPGTLGWAKGVYPHPRGPIRVEWRREGDRIHASVDCPDGVELR